VTSPNHISPQLPGPQPASP